MIDKTNTSPKYWEKILRDQKLGEKQPGLEDEVVELPNIPPRKKAASGSNKDMIRLRDVVDKDDRFFEGHQIKKVRTREKDIPTWAVNNKETQILLLRAFPKLKTNSAQRKRASRWATVITLYYRMNLNCPQIAVELKTTVKTVERLLSHMRKVSKGLRSDTAAPRKERKA